MPFFGRIILPLIAMMISATGLAQGGVSAETPLLDDFILPDHLVQGGMVLARAPSGTVSVEMDGKEIAIGKDGLFPLAFDRDAGEDHILVARLPDGRVATRHFHVAAGNWRIEHVDANPLGGARNSEEFLKKRAGELEQIAAARQLRTDIDGWRQNFVRPVPGRISGLFGAQRIYRGSPGSYHGGMDMAAAEGTEFVAPADGIVTLAAQVPFTLEGHLIIIDHGMGLNSAFLHASKILVETGQAVKQGQVIGLVGKSGRASGPHLHWGMKWNDARIDPLLLLPPQP